MLVAGKFAWVPHVKLPVKSLFYSDKFTCARRQFACVLREVLAASKQVNLPVFTGKLHVTQVNCVRDLFTCELHVKLPAFAGNFARASFTVYKKTIVEGIFRCFWVFSSAFYRVHLYALSEPVKKLGKKQTIRFDLGNKVTAKVGFFSWSADYNYLSTGPRSTWYVTCQREPNRVKCFFFVNQQSGRCFKIACGFYSANDYCRNSDVIAGLVEISTSSWLGGRKELKG